MVGVPIDLLWLISLDLSVNREKRLKKKEVKEKKRSQEREDKERRERVMWRPHPPTLP